MACRPPGWWLRMVQETHSQTLWCLCPLLVFILGISSQSAHKTLPLWWWPVCLLPPIRPRLSSLALAPKVTPRLIPKVSFLAPPEQKRAFSCGSPNDSSGIHPFLKALRQNINFLAWCYSLSHLDYPKHGHKTGTTMDSALAVCSAGASLMLQPTVRRCDWPRSQVGTETGKAEAAYARPCSSSVWGWDSICYEAT